MNPTEQAKCGPAEWVGGPTSGRSASRKHWADISDDLDLDGKLDAVVGESSERLCTKTCRKTRTNNVSSGSEGNNKDDTDLEAWDDVEDRALDPKQVQGLTDSNWGP